MKHAIQELKAIAAFADPVIGRKINQWIEDNVEQASWAILIHHPERPDMQEFRIKQAMHELGKRIAENSNMFPIWEKRVRGFELRISALYFKNEFAKRPEEN